MILLRRSLIKLSGNLVVNFLNSLSTNDLNVSSELVYSAILNQSGRFFCDFFFQKISENECIVNVDEKYLDSFLNKISFYDIRSAIGVERLESIGVFSSNQDNLKKTESFKDPRSKNLGFLIYKEKKNSDIFSNDFYKEYKKRLIENLVMPSEDFRVDKDIILDYNFDLNEGISFSKGCYLGQELMVSMKHKDLIRRKLKNALLLEGKIPDDLNIFNKNEEKIGRICSYVDNFLLLSINKDFEENEIFTENSNKIFLKF